MKLLLASLAIAAVFAPAATAGSPPLDGWPNVSRMTNCHKLQYEFDISMGIAEARLRHGMDGGPHLSRANTANSRMARLHCPGYD